MPLLYPKAPMAASTPMVCDDVWPFLLAEAMNYPPVSASGAPKNRGRLRLKPPFLMWKQKMLPLSSFASLRAIRALVLFLVA